MRWFHHDTDAHNDAKLQILLRKEGLAGLGAFWSILEQIGRDSSSFRLMIDDPPGCWTSFRLRLRGGQPPGRSIARDGIPLVSLKYLGWTLHTGRARLRRMIRTFVDLGLFDRREWEEGRILYSRGFELRADDYTRRTRMVRRRAEAAAAAGKLLGGSPDALQTLSAHCPDNFAPEQNREQQIDAHKYTTPDSDAFPRRAGESPEVASGSQEPDDGPDMDRMYRLFGEQMNQFLENWARRHDGHVPWRPAEEHLLSLWRVALRIAPQGTSRRAEVEAGVGKILSAVQDMFDESTRREIRSPPAYLSASLLGTQSGTRPWVR